MKRKPKAEMNHFRTWSWYTDSNQTECDSFLWGSSHFRVRLNPTGNEIVGSQCSSRLAHSIPSTLDGTSNALPCTYVRETFMPIAHSISDMTSFRLIPTPKPILKVLSGPSYLAAARIAAMTSAI